MCSWWRHQMEIFSALLAICAGNSPVTGEFPTQRPVTRSFDVYFDLRPKERLSKQWWGWWFETLSRSLWRHRNVHKCSAWCVTVPSRNDDMAWKRVPLFPIVRRIHRSPFIPAQRNSNVFICFISLFQPENSDEKKKKLLVNWDAVTLTCHHCNALEGLIMNYKPAWSALSTYFE